MERVPVAVSRRDPAGPCSSARGVNQTPGGGAMSTTLHETPTRPSSPRPPRRRPIALFARGAVLVAAIGAGAALALGGRSAERSDQPAAAATQPAADQATKAAASTPAGRGTASGQRQQGPGSRPGG